MGFLDDVFSKKKETVRVRTVKTVPVKKDPEKKQPVTSSSKHSTPQPQSNSSIFGSLRRGKTGVATSTPKSTSSAIKTADINKTRVQLRSKPPDKDKKPWLRTTNTNVPKKEPIKSSTSSLNVHSDRKSANVTDLKKKSPTGIISVENVTLRRGQNQKIEGQNLPDNLSRTSSTTNLDVDPKGNKGAKPRKTPSRDRIDKIGDNKKHEKKGVTKNNNQLESADSPYPSIDSLHEEEFLQLRRQLQEMAQEKSNLALQLGEQKGQLNLMQKEIQTLKEESNIQLEHLTEENTALRNRLRDVAHSPLSDNEKQQLLYETHRHHSSAPASIATNLIDDGNGGDITACPTPDWDKHSSSNVSEVSVACLQDKINQMQETHYSTNEELQATLQELTDLQRQLTELQQENERLNEEKTLMFDSLCRQTERLNDSRSEVESLKQLLYREKDETGQYELAVEREQKLVDLLKSAQEEREALLVKLEQINNEVQEARAGIIEKDERIAHLSERVRTLESTLDAKHAEHKLLDQELAQAKDQCSGKQIEINRLTDLLDNARTKIGELEQDRALSDKSELDELLDNARKEKDALESEVAHLKEQLAISKNETDKLREQVSILQEECKVTRNNAKTTQSDLEYKCEKLSGEKNALNEQLQEFQDAINELQVQSQCQLEDKRQLSAVLSETQRNLSEAERKNLNLEHELQELKKLREEENEEWEKFQNDLLTSVRVANDFKTEAQQELQRMIMENKSYRERERQLKAEIDKLKGDRTKKGELSTTNSSTKSKLSDKENIPNKEMDSLFKLTRKSKDKPRKSKDSTETVSTESKTDKGKDKKPDVLTKFVKKREKPSASSKRKKTLSVEEELLLKSLNDWYEKIDQSLPEENLTEEQKVVKKLKILYEDDSLKERPVAHKPKDQLAISKPLLDSVFLNPKLEGIAKDPTVRTVEEIRNSEIINYENQVPELRNSLQRTERHAKVNSENFTPEGPKRISIIGRSKSCDDLHSFEENKESPILYRCTETEDLRKEVPLKHFERVSSIAPSDSASNPRYSDFTVVVNQEAKRKELKNKSNAKPTRKSSLNFETLDTVLASIPKNVPEHQLSHEQQFALRLKRALDEAERKNTLKKLKKKAKHMQISSPTIESVQRNSTLRHILLDPEIGYVRRNSYVFNTKNVAPFSEETARLSKSYQDITFSFNLEPKSATYMDSSESIIENSSLNLRTRSAESFSSAEFNVETGLTGPYNSTAIILPKEVEYTSLYTELKPEKVDDFDSLEYNETLKKNKTDKEKRNQYLVPKTPEHFLKQFLEAEKKEFDLLYNYTLNKSHLKQFPEKNFGKLKTFQTVDDLVYNETLNKNVRPPEREITSRLSGEPLKKEDIFENDKQTAEIIDKKFAAEPNFLSERNGKIKFVEVEEVIYGSAKETVEDIMETNSESTMEKCIDQYILSNKIEPCKKAEVIASNTENSVIEKNAETSEIVDLGKTLPGDAKTKETVTRSEEECKNVQEMVEISNCKNLKENIDLIQDKILFKEVKIFNKGETTKENKENFEKIQIIGETVKNSTHPEIQKVEFHKEEGPVEEKSEDIDLGEINPDLISPISHIHDDEKIIGFSKPDSETQELIAETIASGKNYEDISNIVDNEIVEEDKDEYDYHSILKENKYGVISPLNIRLAYKDVVKEIKYKFPKDEEENTFKEDDDHSDPELEEDDAFFDNFFGVKRNEMAEPKNNEDVTDNINDIDKEMEEIFEKYLHTPLSKVITQIEEKGEAEEKGINKYDHPKEAHLVFQNKVPEELEIPHQEELNKDNIGGLADTAEHFSKDTVKILDENRDLKENIIKDVEQVENDQSLEEIMLIIDDTEQNSLLENVEAKNSNVDKGFNDDTIKELNISEACSNDQQFPGNKILSWDLDKELVLPARITDDRQLPDIIESVNKNVTYNTVGLETQEIKEMQKKFEAYLTSEELNLVRSVQSERFSRPLSDFNERDLQMIEKLSLQYNQEFKDTEECGDKNLQANLEENKNTDKDADGLEKNNERIEIVDILMETKSGPSTKLTSENEEQKIEVEPKHEISEENLVTHQLPIALGKEHARKKNEVETGISPKEINDDGLVDSKKQSIEVKTMNKQQIIIEREHLVAKIDSTAVSNEQKGEKSKQEKAEHDLDSILARMLQPNILRRSNRNKGSKHDDLANSKKSEEVIIEDKDKTKIHLNTKVEQNETESKLPTNEKLKQEKGHDSYKEDNKADNSVIVPKKMNLIEDNDNEGIDANPQKEHKQEISSLPSNESKPVITSITIPKNIQESTTGVKIQGIEEKNVGWQLAELKQLRNNVEQGVIEYIDDKNNKVEEHILTTPIKKPTKARYEETSPQIQRIEVKPIDWQVAELKKSRNNDEQRVIEYIDNKSNKIKEGIPAPAVQKTTEESINEEKSEEDSVQIQRIEVEPIDWQVAELKKSRNNDEQVVIEYIDKSNKMKEQIPATAIKETTEENINDEKSKEESVQIQRFKVKPIYWQVAELKQPRNNNKQEIIEYIDDKSNTVKGDTPIISIKTKTIEENIKADESKEDSSIQEINTAKQTDEENKIYAKLQLNEDEIQKKDECKFKDIKTDLSNSVGKQKEDSDENSDTKEQKEIMQQSNNLKKDECCPKSIDLTHVEETVGSLECINASKSNREEEELIKTDAGPEKDVLVSSKRDKKEASIDKNNSSLIVQHEIHHNKDKHIDWNWKEKNKMNDPKSISSSTEPQDLIKERKGKSQTDKRDSDKIKILTKIAVPRNILSDKNIPIQHRLSGFARKDEAKEETTDTTPVLRKSNYEGVKSKLEYFSKKNEESLPKRQSHNPYTNKSVFDRRKVKSWAEQFEKCSLDTQSSYEPVYANIKVVPSSKNKPVVTSKIEKKPLPVPRLRNQSSQLDVENPDKVKSVVQDDNLKEANMSECKILSESDTENVRQEIPDAEFTAVGKVEVLDVPLYYATLEKTTPATIKEEEPDKPGNLIQNQEYSLGNMYDNKNKQSNVTKNELPYLASVAESSYSSIAVAGKFEQLDITKHNDNIEEVDKNNDSNLNLFHLESGSYDESYLNLFKSPEDKVYDNISGLKRPTRGHFHIAYLGEVSDNESYEEFGKNLTDYMKNLEGTSSKPKIIDFVPLDSATKRVLRRNDDPTYDTLEREKTFHVLNTAASNPTVKVSQRKSTTDIKDSRDNSSGLSSGSRTSFSAAKKVFEALLEANADKTNDKGKKNNSKTLKDSDKR